MGKRLRKGKVRDHKHKREHRDAEKGKKNTRKGQCLYMERDRIDQIIYKKATVTFVTIFSLLMIKNRPEERLG